MIKLLAVTILAIVVTGALALRAAPGRTRTFLRVAAVAALAFPVFAVLHNVIGGVFHVEEPVFFLLAVFGAPAAVAIGLVGAAITALQGRHDRPGSGM